MKPIPAKKIVSPSRTYAAHLSPGSESLWDSSHATLVLHNISFDARIFNWHGVWSPCSRYFAVSEWLHVASSTCPDMQLLLVDVPEGKECVVEHVACGFIEPMSFHDDAIRYNKIAVGQNERTIERRAIRDLPAWRPAVAETPAPEGKRITRGLFPATCSCGRTYTHKEWLTLKYDGVQTGYDDRKGRQMFDDLEMRRCRCGSSMALPAELLKKAGLSVP